ncbi:MAG TPA: gamma-glutamyltransferase family protein [Bryobacteraceae bacterium]|nr:gamma-glutamyltransferase family protein [Bryobacteraceae bacterium]
MRWPACLLVCFSVLTARSQDTVRTMFPAVRGLHEMVAAANNMEVAAGIRILEQGGNAVDAGVATVLAATVTEQSRVGLGGEIPILIKLKDKPVIAISGVGVAGSKATVQFFEHRAPEKWEQPGRLAPIPAIGPRAAITPGLVDGLLLALEKYGTLSFAQVAAPAIEYADEGFPIGEEFAEFLGELQPYHAFWPDSFRFFYPNGVAPKRGELVKMPTLANTLRQMAAAESKAKGDRTAKIRAVHDLFYKGDIAAKLADFLDSNGGLITRDDLAKFHAETDEPRTTTYRGYTISKPGFWSQGPVMIEALNILEGFDLKKMGHNSPEYLHTLIETVKLAFADRDRYYGDPKFSKIPEETLLSKEYAAGRRKLIDPQRASMESRPGDLHASVAMVGGHGKSSDKDTTCVNVVDRQGNAFSATPSGAWIPSVIAADTGIPLSVRMESFVVTPGHANQVAPGKRPRVTLSPTVVTRDGQLVLTMSTPGGDNQDQALLQVLLNILEFGMSPQEAVEAPRFQSSHFYNSFGYHEFTPGKVSIEGRIPRPTIQKLIELGHVAQTGADWSNTSAPTVIQVIGGVLNGAADPRRARFVFGR